MTENKKPKIITISGPTATGKTGLGIELSSKMKELFGFEGSVINFDSLLFYKELNIGTAKPTKEEMAKIDHHLVNIESVQNPINASTFVELSQKAIQKVLDEGKVPILVGGSGFYLRAFIKGMYEAPTTDSKIVNELNEIYEKEGIEPFLKELREVDPESFEALHQNDHYRITRAIEFYRTTGEKISDQKKKSEDQKPYDFSINQFPEWDFHHIFLDIPKETHWKIIEKRTQKMLDEGILDEVKRLLEEGVSPELRPMKSIGHKEAVEFINGDIPSLEALFERIVISTRQLAKSQRTFFKKVTPKSSYNPMVEKDKIWEDLTSFLNQ